MGSVRALFIYPIKSCGGLQLDALQLDACGPVDDRRWMIVDEDGSFMTQRECARMASIQVTLEPEHLVLSVTARPPLVIQRYPADGHRRNVRVWRWEGPALDCGDEAASWLQNYLGRACRLVRFLDDVRRPVNPAYTRFPSQVRFADGYPLLLIGQASLDDLSQRANRTLDMRRFRPNVVVDGVPAYAEDGWRQIKLGEIVADVVKACDRCRITTLDPHTLAIGQEPLRTLATYRRVGQAVVFGQNCVHHAPGWIHAGDPLQVLT
jgi:uncharacterized protein YcbX